MTTPSPDDKDSVAVPRITLKLWLEWTRNRVPARDRDNIDCMAQEMEAVLAAPLPECGTRPLLDEYRRRANGLKEALERSQQMERDFLEKKVLNTQANDAMNEVSAKQRIFTVWLLQVSDDLIAECLPAPVSATRSIAEPGEPPFVWGSPEFKEWWTKMGSPDIVYRG